MGISSKQLTKLINDNTFKSYSKFNAMTSNQWREVLNYSPLPEEFIKEYAYKFDRFHWESIFQFQKLSETFIENVIEKYSDKVDWYYISRYQTLSEKFIEKYSDKLDWRDISHYQFLSESFIEKFTVKVNWNLVSMYQKLSEKFINKYFSIEKIYISHDIIFDEIQRHNKCKKCNTHPYELYDIECNEALMDKALK